MRTGAGRRFLHLLWCAQLAALDVGLRGPGFYGVHPRAIGHLVASVALLHLVASVRWGRGARVAVAVAIAASVVLQISFFAYYHAPFDDQAAVAARLAWGDVRAIVIAGVPAAAAAAVGLAALEFGWLALIGGGRGEDAGERGGERDGDGAGVGEDAAGGTSLNRIPPRNALVHRAPPPRSFDPPSRVPSRRRRGVAALVVAAGVLLGGPLRHATTELRTAQAAAAFALASAPEARAAHAPVPPLVSRRARVPSVLFIVTESVRAADYCGDAAEPCAVAPEVSALLPERVALRELRATSAYTAISMSAILTGLVQVGPRAAIAAAPDLFDLARAVREDERALGVHYWSAQSPSFFERADPASAVDSFVSGDTLAGHPIEDVEEAVAGGFDRRLAAECAARLPALQPPYLVVLHPSGTHAPYFVDEARAPFQPYRHTASWAGLEDLHRAYRNAIFEQDRSLAVCVRAFLAAQRGGPYVVVLTSDHGEAFGEHRAIHHGQSLYDEQIHVPGFIAAGGGALSPDELAALASARDAPVTHLDLLPTLLDALGVLDHFAIGAARARMPGRSLLRPPPPVSANGIGGPFLPITNCSEMWRCPMNAWGMLAGRRKLTAQVWDGEWRCLALEGGEHEVELGQCAELVAASRAVFATKPNGAANE